MAAIIWLDEAEARKWAWDLLGRRGRRRLVLELLDSDNAAVGVLPTTAIFVAQRGSLIDTPFRGRIPLGIDASEPVVIAVGRLKKGRKRTHVDWVHSVEPVFPLARPFALNSLLAVDGNARPLRPVGDLGPRIVRFREWDKSAFLSALLEMCEGVDGNAVKRVIQASSQSMHSGQVSEVLAQERDATISAMKISGVVSNLDELRNVPDDENDPTPFLGRVLSARSGGDRDAQQVSPPIHQLEDSVIGVDARHVWDWIGRETGHAAAMVFENEDGRRLTVINANRLGIEAALGTDLVYYSGHCRSYVLVQYKMMSADGRSRTEATNWRYRPDKKFEAQLHRMMRIENHQRAQDHSALGHLAYRLGPPLTYFKFCRHDAGLDQRTNLITGSYVPTDYIKMLVESMAGPKGGAVLDAGGLRDRSLGNNAFISLVRTSLIGSSGATSDELCRVIEESLEGNRSVVFATPDI
ncbi:hypothetical protein [Nocardia brasiliensis]